MQAVVMQAVVMQAVVEYASGGHARAHVTHGVSLCHATSYSCHVYMTVLKWTGRSRGRKRKTSFVGH